MPFNSRYSSATPKDRKRVSGVAYGRDNKALCRVLGRLQVTPDGLELVHGIGRTREDAIQAVARQLGFPPYSENLLIAAGWTIGRLRAFVEEP
jgi:hypothetical protein